MGDNTHWFAVSWVGIQVAQPAITAFVSLEWNAHQIISLLPHEIPSTSEAIHMHKSAIDPLTRESMYLRECGVLNIL